MRCIRKFCLPKFNFRIFHSRRCVHGVIAGPSEMTPWPSICSPFSAVSSATRSMTDCRWLYLIAVKRSQFVDSFGYVREPKSISDVNGSLFGRGIVSLWSILTWSCLAFLSAESMYVFLLVYARDRRFLLKGGVVSACDQRRWRRPKGKIG